MTIRAENEHGKAESTATLKPEPPAFIDKLKDVLLDQGATLTLSSKISGQSTEVAWYRNGKRLKASKTIKMTCTKENNYFIYTLEITDTDTDKDSGEYKCFASNASGKISQSCNVTVRQNVFVEMIKDTEADDESDVVFKCVTKYPTPVEWFHDGAPLTPSKSVIIQTSDREHKLILRNVSKASSGSYCCAFDDQSTACSLRIQEPLPEFTRKLSDLEVKERESPMFSVEVSIETAQVTWHKDGERLESADRYEFITKGHERFLIIRSATVHDEGEYTCSLGEQECTAELVVIELPPEIIMSLKDVTVRRGEVATFEIELTKGDARVRWYKGTTEIQFSEHIQLAIDGKRQRLMVYDCNVEDVSEYSCTVGVQKSAAKLTILAPAVDFTARLPSKQTVSQGQDVTFTVKLSSPDADVTWLKNGEVIVDSDRIKSNY